jgi:hypothetical protein
MSYILKTAAMSLLSKTLQTFLYKYLSDVDVEGVALPSVYDGSGWGVRLSNVKLREGVQLMMAPGKVTKKRRRRKKKKSKRKPPQRRTTTTTTTNKVIIPEAARSEATSQVTQISKEAFVTETRTEPARALYDHPTEEESELNGELNGSLHLQDLDDMRAIDYNDDDGEEGSRPSTPIQDSKSFFSCFHNSRANLNNDPSKIPNISLHGTEQQSFPDVIIIDQTLEEGQAERDLRKDEVKYPAQEQEEEEEWEEYEEYEQAVKLCLGENGRIGTLDIR